MTGSNRRPPACKAGALPAELTARAGTVARSQAVPERRNATGGRLSLLWSGFGRIVRYRVAPPNRTEDEANAVSAEVVELDAEGRVIATHTH